MKNKNITRDPSLGIIEVSQFKRLSIVRTVVRPYITKTLHWIIKGRKVQENVTCYYLYKEKEEFGF